MSWIQNLFGKNKKASREDMPVKENDRKNSDKRSEITDKLLADRIIFLGTPIDDAAAQTLIAQMLFLEHQSPTEDINLYVNSPGGSISASFAIYDTIKSIKPDVATICIGQAGGTAAILAAGGCKEKRFAQPSSRFIFFKVKAGENIFLMGQAEKNTYQNELKRMKYLVVDAFVKETGQPAKKILSAMKNDLILSATEAVEFGLVDAIVSK